MSSSLMAAVGKHKEDMKPEYVISSGYDPIKSEEETDEEQDDEDTNTINQHIKKECVEVKTEDISTDDEYSNEKKEPLRRRKSPRLLANHATHSNTSIQESVDIQHTNRKRR